jgi:exosome complex RNA-binding protein Rrp42 (RNase PH superfamily)
VEFNVDCSPNATPMFEGRRGGEEIEAEISSLFSRFFSVESVCDLEKLCIVPGLWCWVIYVDILSK